jgi:hypothetical protein
MKTKIYTVNSCGMLAIRDWVEEKTKGLDWYHTTQSALDEWAADIERSLGNGNGACAEMPAHYSNSGRVETLELSDDQLNVEECEDE